MRGSSVLGFEQVFDLALGLLLDPGVDRAPGSLGVIAEIDRVQPALVVDLDPLLEVGKDALAGLTPEGVGGEELDIGRFF